MDVTLLVVMTRTLSGTALVHDEIVPRESFTEMPGGARRTLTDFRQRNALVVCFLHDDCEPCLKWARALSDVRRDIELADARVRVVARSDGQWPFPVFVDRDLRGSTRLLGGGDYPVIVLLDRYAAAWESWPARDHAFPAPEEVVGTLVKIMCSECLD